MSFFSPTPITLWLLQSWGGIPRGLCELQRNKTNTKDRKDLVLCSYCLHEHPPAVTSAESNMHHITKYRASIKWFNHSVLVIMQNWQKIFHLLPEIAEIPLEELNKDTIKRNVKQPDKWEQQTAKVSTCSKESDYNLCHWIFKNALLRWLINTYFLMCFFHDMMYFSRHICGCSGCFFLQKIRIIR